MKTLLLVATHGAAPATGFAGGIYFLPILIAPPAPSASEVKSATSDARPASRRHQDLRERHLAAAGGLRPGASAKYR